MKGGRSMGESREVKRWVVAGAGAGEVGVAADDGRRQSACLQASQAVSCCCSPPLPTSRDRSPATQNSGAPFPDPVQGEQRTHLDCDVFFPLCHHQAYGRRVVVMVIESIVHRSQAVLHKLKHLGKKMARDSGGQGACFASVQRQSKQAGVCATGRDSCQLLPQVPQPSVPRASLCKHVSTDTQPTPQADTPCCGTSAAFSKLTHHVMQVAGHIGKSEGWVSIHGHIGG
jgi:hypothetical protein